MQILLLAELNLRSGHPDTVIKPMTDLLRKTPELRKSCIGSWLSLTVRLIGWMTPR